MRDLVLPVLAVIVAVLAFLWCRPMQRWALGIDELERRIGAQNDDRSATFQWLYTALGLLLARLSGLGAASRFSREIFAAFSGKLVTPSRYRSGNCVPFKPVGKVDT